MSKVTAPVEGFTGVVVGVNFSDGVGKTDDEGALAYFNRHGYTVGGHKDAEEPKSPDGPKPLADQTKKELEATAEAEGVEFKNPINKTDLSALIEAHRAE